ncbi:restriction endonuclease subunit S [Caldimonas sp. KR1-144]|uniref:restriction endonuclease subunit S n=1 Tax=Caldimonas sp. KR1-144 TaxID=3400911 RepID=UPI003C05DF01
MNADELLRHFDRVADAPDAVPRLRELVLELAMRGKLVPQNRNDDSQADALSDARAQLAELARRTGRLRFTPSEPIADERLEPSLPDGWITARVNDTGLYINGLAFKPADWKPTGLPIIRIQNLTDESREFNYAEGEFPDEVVVRSGDILVSWSATLDAFRWRRETGVLNQHIFRVIPAAGLTTDSFLLLLLKRAIREMAESVHAHGLVMTHINRGPFLNHVVHIPPLAEQHRIVAKVDELMALCDRLDAARTEREAARDRLTAANLARLSAPDTETFKDDARFARAALPALAARSDQMRAWRDTVCRMALLGRFSDGGRWPKAPCHVRDYVRLQSGYAFKSEWFGPTGVRLLRNANVAHGRVNWAEQAFLPYELTGAYERFMLNAGDLVLSLNRPFIATGTKVAQVQPSDLPALLVQRVARLEIAEGLSPDYLLLWLQCSLFQEQVQPVSTNVAPHIAPEDIGRARIFVPDLEEQRRVVNKVAGLMGLCEQLEAGLNAATEHRSRLLDVLLRHALEPAEVMEAAA